MKKAINYRLLLIALSLSLSSFVSHLSSQTFGYLSNQKVLNELPQYVEGQKKLSALRKEYEKEMARAEQSFSKQYAEYIDGQKSFTEDILMKRQKELQQLMQQSLQFKQEAEKKLAQKESELTVPLRNRISEIIGVIAVERNLDYVINTDSDAYLFINKNNGVDLTEEVLKRMQE